MLIDHFFIKSLLDLANSTEKLRKNFDLRNSAIDTSQRMLNALQPETQVPIHRHINTSETVICLCGRIEEVFYEAIDAENTKFKETSRTLLCPIEGYYGIQIPIGVWHSINVIEPSVIFEAKDGIYKG